MDLYRTQPGFPAPRYLVITDGKPTTRTCRGLIVVLTPPSVRRVKDVRALLRQERWLPPTPGGLTLDGLTARVPALRPFRGIEVRLPSGETAWVCWRQWSGANEETLTLLSEMTAPLTVPVGEPDADFYLAAQAVRTLGGAVLDPPRAQAPAPNEAY